jgi:hypothetical protein
MKNKQLMAEISRRHQEQGNKIGHCQNGRRKFFQIKTTQNKNKKTTMNLKFSMQKQVLFSYDGCLADSDDVRDFLGERLGSGYHLGGRGVASIYL